MLTTKDVAERLNVHPRTIRNLIETGELIAYKFGRDYRITETDLETFIKNSRINSHSTDDNSNY